MDDSFSEIHHYDVIYSRHTDGNNCPVSIANLTKARKRVRQVRTAFGVELEGMRVLDLGCGLGYVAEAMRLEGAHVVGLDASAIAIRRAAERFPLVSWRHALFPDGIADQDRFDIVWMLDIWPLNTFNVMEMRSNVLDAALARLTSKGKLLVGWHSDFSGAVRSNWRNWPFTTLFDMRNTLGFSGPRVPQLRWASMSWLTMVACKISGKSCPIFLMRRALPSPQCKEIDLAGRQDGQVCAAHACSTCNEGTGQIAKHDFSR